MKCELICFDIDGTLLNDNKELLFQDQKALQNVANKGVKIALASGRMPAGVEVIEKNIGVQCIKICNAGTYTLFQDKVLSAEYLSTDIMNNIYIEIAQKNNVPLWIFRNRKWYVTGIDKYVEREIKIIGCQPDVADAEELVSQWKKEKTGPSKLVIAAEANKISKIYNEIRDKNWQGVDIARSAETFLEIFPEKIDKGRALEAVCEKLGIDIKNTVAFGDQELDIPMINKAGIGVAMGNAIEELKEKADFVTKTNNEAGVAYALEHILPENHIL